MKFEPGKKRYNDYPTFFKTLFEERVQKLSIDGGFTCPNRDGSKGVGGCSFCNNESFNPDYCRAVRGITEQIDEGIRFFARKYKGQRYLAYFQAYSNTYAPLDVLKLRYEEALAHPMISGLVIGTRPDVVSEEILDYLEELAQRYYVCVEYGVESVNDTVLHQVNRGHDFAASVDAICRTAEMGIAVGAHMILGLPGENREMILSHADKMSRLPLDTIKLHQLQLILHTRMAAEYKSNPNDFHLYDVDEYIDLAIDFAERLSPHIAIERFVSQSPAELLIAPNWGIKNYEFTARLLKRMKERDTWQGKLFTEV